jgi:hypothetical protein
MLFHEGRLSEKNSVALKKDHIFAEALHPVNLFILGSKG